ncbi:MAG: metallophosphatase, partial [Flavobacteriaceae bacterium]
VEVLHTNPKLYYIPKQNRLGVYNDEFGDELYMIEEHVGDTQKTLPSFGSPEKILSTADVLQEIHKSGKSVVDEPSYIKARMFDMLLGDWDRHEDQWRWALFKNEDGTEFCEPIPRDRDQAFSKYDGSLISLLTRAIPGLRKMQSYDDDLRSVKWFATSPYHLDLTLINNSDWDVWEKQTKYIQSNITDSVIEKAFEVIPEEIKGQTIEDIKMTLKGRRDNLMKIAREYYTYLNKFEVITGTQKGDTFKITRLPHGKTTIEVHRKDVGILNRTFSKDITREIWVYGLDGKDTFVVEGEGTRLIPIKIMGGKKNDTYDFKNKHKVKLYDYKNKENTIVTKGSKKWLVDDYDVNNYDHRKVKHNFNQLLPIIAFNPDDGLQLGLHNTNIFYGLQRNPFTQKHVISASYYTGNSGYDFSYKGEFSNIFHNWNFGVEGKYTSPNFAENFFGLGNETSYDKDAVDLDFNRVRIRQWNAAISLIYRGKNGGAFHIRPLVESFEVENTEDRFISDVANVDPNSTFFEKQTYAGAELAYEYQNKDNPAFPTLGMDFKITGGYKTNIDGSSAENNFGYLIPELAFDHKLNRKGSLVFATKVAGEVVLGDDFEFYHGAQIGGINGLRGFRNERFVGKQSFYQNTDLRIALGGMRTSVIPLRFGISGSYDYGRVWLENDTSNVWHTSYGGSLWLSGVNAISANMGYFNSDDGGRIVFVLGFAF